MRELNLTVMKHAAEGFLVLVPGPEDDWILVPVEYAIEWLQMPFEWAIGLQPMRVFDPLRHFDNAVTSKKGRV